MISDTLTGPFSRQLSETREGQAEPACRANRDRERYLGGRMGIGGHRPLCYRLNSFTSELAVGDVVAAGAGVVLKVSIRIFQSSPSRITDQ